MQKAKLCIYVTFALGLAVACYRRPVPDDFDRYVYEALIRSGRQPIQEIYTIVKHESARAESSSVMDSPEHLAQLEPLYVIRPLYVQFVSTVDKITADPQKAINLVSAASLFICALLVGAATQRYLYSALLMLAPGILTAGRMGTPDAFSALAVLASYIALIKNELLGGLIFLMLSIWIRTDNILFVLAILCWLAWDRKLRALHASVLALVAVASVEWINRFSGNYGWKVLFYYSFVGGKYPAEITPHIGLMRYVQVALTNGASIGPQVAPWLLLGIAAWALGSTERRGLIPILIASVLRYLLFPSGEGRYFVWAYLLIGTIFIRAVTARQKVYSLAIEQTPSYHLSAGVA